MNDKERDKVEGECAEALATTEWTGDVTPQTMSVPSEDVDYPSPGVVERVSTVNSPSVLGVEPDYKAQVELLTAHLITKGYGHAAIKRILKGEVVR